MTILQKGRQDKILNETLWLISLIEIGVIFVGRYIAPWWISGNHPTGCMFRIITGHYCPLCGMTRSVTAALQGNLFLSVYENPMGIILLLTGAFILLWQLITTVIPYHFTNHFWLHLAKAIGFCLLINWVVLIFVK